MLMVPRTPLDEWTAGLLGSDRLSRPALERRQLDRLNRVVSWARDRSPFYRRLYAGLPSAPLPDIAAASELPFVTEGDLREHGLDMLCVSQGDVARVVTLPTSGTTGPPKRVWFTDADLEHTVDYFHHGMKDVLGTGKRLLVLMPGEQPGTVGALLRTAIERLGVETIVYGFVDRADVVCRVIEEREVDCLVGVPGQVLALARSDAGRAIAPGRLKSVLLSGDHVAVSLREGLEAVWGCEVFEHYGSTEIGLGGAVQCRAFAGRHIREADLLFEVVDPVTGAVVPDGQDGELVVTTLTREGMPFLRYRTGDLGRIDPGACPCGSTLRCLGRVRGRLADTVDPAGAGALGMADLDEALFALPWVTGFSAAVGLGGGPRRLVLEVVTATEAPSDAAREAQRRLSALAAISRAGLMVEVTVAAQAEIAGGAAKRRIKGGVEP